MTKTTLLLAALPAADAMAATPSSGAELAASLALALSALVLAYIGLRRGVTAGAHNRALEQLLVAEREARQQSEQALAASHDVLCRLVRRQDGAQPAPGAADSLRHALERCLAEHAQSHGVRYRFEAGVDPAAQPVGRAARLALFQVLQEVLAANAGRNGSADLHVRLNQSVRMLALDIQGGAAATRARAPAPLPDALARQVSTLGGILRVAAAPGRPTHWSLTLPGQRQSETAAIT